jgi:hypothetical protein
LGNPEIWVRFQSKGVIELKWKRKRLERGERRNKFMDGQQSVLHRVSQGAVRLPSLILAAYDPVLEMEWVVWLHPEYDCRFCLCFKLSSKAFSGEGPDVDVVAPAGIFPDGKRSLDAA